MKDRLLRELASVAVAGEVGRDLGCSRLALVGAADDLGAWLVADVSDTPAE
ncbi:MAG TPA: hypothetical protein VE078_06025 [Thermoanaerobaculia bacterium]|nr:hypothetical protein [Thermoanaerobaculia bacterium]